MNDVLRNGLGLTLGTSPPRPRPPTRAGRRPRRHPLAPLGRPGCPAARVAPAAVRTAVPPARVAPAHPPAPQNLILDELLIRCCASTAPTCT